MPILFFLLTKFIENSSKEFSFSANAINSYKVTSSANHGRYTHNGAMS